jgi:hypothetical protein
MKTINKFLFIFLSIFIFTNCDNFEEINNNPDTTTKVTPAMICTNVVLRTIKNSGDAKSFIDPNGLAKYIAYTEGVLSSQYNGISNTYFDILTILPNLDQMVEYATETLPDDNSYRGVALFVKSYIFFRGTLEVGDMPYSEANEIKDGIYHPKYDTQESIFIGILDDLKKADQYFAVGQTFAGDPIYNGDPAKWRKATNALALKILMTLSKKEAVASLNVKSRFQEIFSANNLITSNSDNYKLNYANQTGMYHPLYSTTVSMFTQATLPGTLLIDNLKKLNDHRLFYYAEPSAVKLGEGKTEGDTAAYVGVHVEKSYPEIVAIQASSDYSPLNIRYSKLPACEPRILLGYGEQSLIIAEAILRGWVSGDAQAYYENGVKAALAFVGTTDPDYCHGMPVTDTYIQNYFTGEAAFKTTSDDQLEQIWLQRYLLNFMQDPQFSYFEYRRTGYPEFPIDPTTNLNVINTRIPVRYLYPTSETSYNIDNLTEALNRQYDGYDEVNKVMWLLK